MAEMAEWAFCFLPCEWVMGVRLSGLMHDAAIQTRRDHLLALHC
jgi:hypothetical protein